MTSPENRVVKYVLEQLYIKLCNCRRDYEELDNLLDPAFHLEDCLYKSTVEKEDIEWKREQTQ